MPKSNWRRYIRRMQKRGPNYTLYGIIAGAIALLAIATLVYPRYDRVQNLFKARNGSYRARDASGRYRKTGSTTPRSRTRSDKDIRVENEIMDAGRMRTDTL